MPRNFIYMSQQKQAEEQKDYHLVPGSIWSDGRSFIEVFMVADDLVTWQFLDRVTHRPKGRPDRTTVQIFLAVMDHIPHPCEACYANMVPDEAGVLACPEHGRAGVLRRGQIVLVDWQDTSGARDDSSYIGPGTFMYHIHEGVAGGELLDDGPHVVVRTSCDDPGSCFPASCVTPLELEAKNVALRRLGETVAGAPPGALMETYRDDVLALAKLVREASTILERLSAAASTAGQDDG